MTTTEYDTVQVNVIGQQGPRGATWFSGATDPDSGTGEDGDFYLQTDDGDTGTKGDVWVKADGAWSVSTNIEGPQGEAGATGPTGATGATGATGPAYSPTRVAEWARNWQGVKPAPTYLDTAPTNSCNPSASTLNSNTNGAATAPATDDRLNYGLETVGVASVGGYNSQSLTNTAGAKSGGPLLRVRFKTDAPAIELVWYYSPGTSAHANMRVDDKIAKDGMLSSQRTASGNYYEKFDFGSDTQSYELLQVGNATLNVGSGYAIGDVITLAGGTSTSPAKLVVLSLGSGSAVGKVGVADYGAYSAVPTGTITQDSTTGSGTGFSISDSGFTWGKMGTTRKMRHIELLVPSITIKGVNVDSNSVILPWEVPADLPRIVFVGDSQLAGTYQPDAGDFIASRIAWRLGLQDSYAINAQGGTGWNTDNGSAARWSNAYRIADYEALSPDIIVFIGSQNDTQNAALQTAVTDTINTLHTDLADVLIVCIGSVVSTNSDYTKAGVLAATDQSRVRYIDNVTDNPWIFGTGYTLHEASDGNSDFYRSSDVNHLNREGRRYFADCAAALIGDAIVDMALAA